MSEGRDLRGFLDFLTDRAGRDREGEAATEAEDHDGVRLMTVHAAKGLEFPVVAVADPGAGVVKTTAPVVEAPPPKPAVAPKTTTPAAKAKPAPKQVTETAPLTTGALNDVPQAIA